MPVETLGSLERRLSIVVPLADVEKEVDVRLKRIARTVKMSGFRPGKVPMKIVAQQYGYQTQNDVLNEKVGSAFAQAVEEHKLRVAGAPRIEPKQGAGGDVEGQMTFDATFEIYPEIKVGELTGVTLEKPSTSVGEAEVDKTIDILRKQRVHYHAKGESHEHSHAEPAGADAAAKSGDRVTIDFAGTLDGVAFEGGSGKDFAFVLGEGRMLPEFEAAVTGLKAGESKTFPLTFPADYHGKDVAGKTVEFTATVKQIEWAHMPEVDAEFAKSLGIADGDMAKMRQDIRSNLEREVKKRIQGRVKDGVMEALLKACSFDVPKTLVEGEVGRLVEMAREDMKRRGMKIDNMPIPPELFKDQAERRVRLGLILAELVRTHNLQARPEQVKAQIEEFAQSYEDPAEVLRWYYADRTRLGEVEALVLEENVVKYVMDQAKVAEVSVPFDDLMGSNAQGRA